MELDQTFEHLHINVNGVADEKHKFILDPNNQDSSDNYSKLIQWSIANQPTNKNL